MRVAPVRRISRAPQSSTGIDPWRRTLVMCSAGKLSHFPLNRHGWPQCTSDRPLPASVSSRPNAPLADSARLEGCLESTSAPKYSPGVRVVLTRADPDPLTVARPETVIRHAGPSDAHASATAAVERSALIVTCW